MGNQKNSTGLRVFDDVYSFPQDSQDLADDIYDAYNVRVGTSAERQSLPAAQQKPSMLWVETDGERRVMRTDGAGAWTDILGGEVIPLTTFSVGWSATTSYAPYMVAEGNKRTIWGATTRGAGGLLGAMLTVPVGHRPSANTFLSGGTTSGGTAFNTGIQPSGNIWVPYGGGSSAGEAYPLTGSWRVA